MRIEPALRRLVGPADHQNRVAEQHFEGVVNWWPAVAGEKVGDFQPQWPLQQKPMQHFWYAFWQPGDVRNQALV